MANIRVADRFIKTATVKTCFDTYKDLRRLNPSLYRYASDDGLSMTVNYADFNPSAATNKAMKTIVALHGAPGNFHCFNPIGEYFLKKNIRLIAPNLPDFSHTRQNRSFYHSTAEKVQFLKDFLRMLKVDEIDCLCAHSLGVQTISALWDQPEQFMIKSVAMFAPQPLWYKEDKIIKTIIKRLFFKSELWYKLLDTIGLYKYDIFPMKFANLNEFFLICCTIYDEQSPKDLGRRFEVLSNQLKLPFTVLYGTNDGIIPRSIVRRLIKELNIPIEAQVILNVEKDDIDSLRMSHRSMFYNIQDGKHFVHTTHWPYSVKIIENLLSYNDLK